ncbi:hypothetical protein DU500_07235 [Haloplanus rubicundus]|uniref:Uncharacterized protein n=1 Tax=Haloplanus rubicundus TaxID=1547898 RepID=A0A345E231_9EURY|nr:hypothetical protein [Haloplanus rubicundus]AXG06253.1 hypothetical protein DU500_07235 [Haloplanus rubicundus]
MTDADADADVRAALHALATDDGVSTVDTDAIDEAAAALDDVRDAAAFVAADGLPRLRRAIDRADRAGDDAAVRRGRDALDALERCRRAAANHFYAGS